MNAEDDGLGLMSRELLWVYTRVVEIKHNGKLYNLPMSQSMLDDGNGIYMAPVSKNDAVQIRDMAQAMVNACSAMLSMQDDELSELDHYLQWSEAQNQAQKSISNAEKIRAPKIEKGYVYIYTNGDKYKIGKSKADPGARMREAIRAAGVIGNDSEYRMLATAYVDDYHTCESAFHEVYAEYRQGTSEWFDLPREEVDEILNYFRRIHNEPS